MIILLATGIFPPDIGGPATYADELSRALRRCGHTVRVLTYGNSPKATYDDGLFFVERSGSCFLRWLRYARALRQYGHDADVVIALSSVSVGVPLLFSRLRGPRRVLRLGGEFFWERFTDAGGMLGLDAWHRTRFGVWRFLDRVVMPRLLRSFHVIVYSTEMQQSIHRRTYRSLPSTTVIENAVPPGTPVLHQRQTPLRLLILSRFVGFKNLLAFVRALSILGPAVRCTCVGDGPMRACVQEEVARQGLQAFVEFQAPVQGSAKMELFALHDLLVIPSVTEISPNTALEARASGLPVLLTEATGLSPALRQGMMIAPMQTAAEIADALRRAIDRYDALAQEAATPPRSRGWEAVAEEWERVVGGERGK